MLEALACGLPVVCRADPALSGVVVDDVNGRQYRDAGDFERTLGDLLADPGLRRRWSRGAAATAAGFGAERFVSAVSGVYDSVLGDSSLGGATSGGAEAVA